MTLTVGALTAERRPDSIAKGAQSPVIFSRVRDGLPGRGLGTEQRQAERWPNALRCSAFLRLFVKVAHKPGLLERTIAEWLVVRGATSTKPDLILIQAQFEPTAFRLSCRPLRIGRIPPPFRKRTPTRC